MRMWLIDTSELCDQHLLGAHQELHTIKGTAEKHKDGRAILKSLADQGMIDLSIVQGRHLMLVYEMQRRGMDHNSPLSFENPFDFTGSVDTNKSRRDLISRCDNCKHRIKYI